MTLLEQMTEIGARAKAASRRLALLAASQKNMALAAMAEALVANSGALKAANAKDMEFGRQIGLSSAMLDRLLLDDKRINAMAEGLRQVAALHDPVGRVLDERVRPNGLRLKKIATPIGVVVIIYESRPNVTADAAGLCLKTGNATILRGGKEAVHSNQLIVSTMIDAARKAVADFPADAIQMVPTTDREAIPALLSLTQYVDLCMPRGGEGLIRAVAECSKVPVIKHYKGVCHVYVHGEADLTMAENIIIDAKCRRPGVCNAMETLLVDEAVAPSFLPRAARSLAENKVELRCDAAALALLKPLGPGLDLKEAVDQDFHTEYNDRILNIRIVPSLEAAIEHISKYGSAHSDSIVTKDEPAAKRFMSAVDSAAVYWNASTRFTDGGEFGMGAEIGISTDKIGARGPMGLDELCTYKWLGFGTGQTRG